MAQGSMPVTRSGEPIDWDELVLTKLKKLLGDEQGKSLHRITLTELDLSRLSSAEDLFTFADALRRHGGFIEAMGAVLRIQAILKGAKSNDGNAT